MKIKRLFSTLVVALTLGLTAMAAVPSGYYDNAKNKSDQALMTALHQIIKGHTKRGYQQLWTDFKSTDCNGTIIIDRYADTQFTYNTDRCGYYSGVGDCYNREHSVPNSWWGGDENDTAYTDLHHMFPVDGWVNNERGNNPFGDCANGSPKGTGKLGRCTFSGYSGTVFEVADEYKGDFARVYFYFATRYMTRISDFTSGTGSVVFSSSTYLGLTTWAINQLLEWHRNDPVSTLETTRNDVVYSKQLNRNPFVDNPELVEYIWGNMKGSVWNATAATPTLTAPVNGTTINVGTNTGNGVSKSITVKGVNLTKSLTVIVSGTGFAVSPTTLTASAVNNGTTVTVTYNGTDTDATGTLVVRSSEVSSVVNLTASYSSGTGPTGDVTIETWEGCSGYNSYSTTSIQGHAFLWNTNDVGIWSGDPNCNDALSCRFGKSSASSIEMAQDVANGASKVTFYAANWSANEASPTLQLQYSTNAGNTWTNVGSCQPDESWKQYSFTMNVTGNVRFRIVQTAGARLNIDDIAITSNTAAPSPSLTFASIDDIEAVQFGESSIVSSSVLAENNTEDITLSVGNAFELSLDRSHWSHSLTLDPSGEVFYVRLANTDVIAEYDGTISASTSAASTNLEVHGTVSGLLGDVNMDGNINISDVTVLISYVLGASVSTFNKNAADLTGDGNINITDVTMLISIVLNSKSLCVTQWNAVPVEGGIKVENPIGEALEVYDFDGNCIALMSGNGQIELTPGIYVVASDTASRKVVVK